MPDEQDRAEALDDEKGPLDDTFDASEVDLLDQTADADPGEADAGRDAIDDDESGDDLVGTSGDPDNAPDPFHDEPPAPEVAAMHRTDEP
jgi:hypothetical protein